MARAVILRRTTRIGLRLRPLPWLLGLAETLACGPDRAQPASGSIDTADAGHRPTPVADVEVNVRLDQRYQTLVGFGAAVVYYADFLSRRDFPGDDVYQVLFPELGLDILRVANWYQNEQISGTSESTPFSDDELVTIVEQATAVSGRRPKLMMSSWSPPAYLKSNGSTKNGGTLRRNGDAFQYDEFARWWVNALSEYAARGVEPDFISIQNEPDWSASWETCEFGPAAGTLAGYPEALAAVRSAINASALAHKPELWGPEPIGIGYGAVQGYLARTNAEQLDGIAHHLYHGGDMADDPEPDSFVIAMQNLATLGSDLDLPLYMTEFQPRQPTLINTAWLIHNALSVAGVSAYIYWPLFWAPGAAPAPPVTLEDPSVPFSNPKGYVINDAYYPLWHYARFTESGWVRVETAVRHAEIKATAFLAPAGNELTIVLINVGESEHALKISVPGFTAHTIAAYRTSGEDERRASIALDVPGVLLMPPRSLVTATLAR